MNLETLTLPLEVSQAAFNTGIKAAIAGTTALVGVMGLAVKGTFDWANDLDKLGDVAGGTNEELAALNFVARKSGVSIDTLAKGTVILEKGLVKANGQLDTTGKALKGWGINVLDTNGKLKTQTTLMGDIAKKYSEFGTQQEKVNFLTEVFGKGGAELIDFFDTLAAEGGIDAVTKKVQDLGLAIDPGRYEQFNRNMEEMKMIGLGLAVGFTEQLMPAFEAVSKWVFEEGIPALKSFGSDIKKAFDKGGLMGVADFLLDGFDKIDWSQVSQTMIDGINSIDWAQVGMDFSAFVTRVSTSIGEAFGEFDWLGLGNSLASALNNFVAGMFGTDEAGMQLIVQTKLAEIQTEMTNWANGAPSSLDSLDAGVNATVNTAFTNMGNTIKAKLKELDMSFVTWSQNTWNTIRTWGANLLAEATKAGNTLKDNLDRKLTEITEIFSRKAGSWITKAVEAFNNKKGELLSTVQGLVDAVNQLFRRIVTSFKLSITLPDWMGGGGGGGTTGGGGGTHTGPGGGACFVAGTLVAMADGKQKPIEEVRKGDRVLSWHNGELIQARVVKTFAHPPDEAPLLVRINGRLTATPDHLIYTSDGWKAAGKITREDVLLEREGSLSVWEVGAVDTNNLPVFNLHTDHESHDYFANGILVHNAKFAAGSSFDALPALGFDAFNLGALGSSGGEPVRVSSRGGQELQPVMIANWGDFPFDILASEVVKEMNNR